MIDHLKMLSILSPLFRTLNISVLSKGLEELDEIGYSVGSSFQVSYNVSDMVEFLPPSKISNFDLKSCKDT